MTYVDDLSAIGARADRDLDVARADLALAESRLLDARQRIADLERQVGEQRTLTLTVSGVATSGGYGSFRLGWSAPAGTTEIRTGRDGAGGEPPWETTDPATATGRDYEWLVPGRTYTVWAEAIPSGARAEARVPLPANPAPEPQPPIPTVDHDNRYGFMVFLGGGKDGVDKDVAGIVAAGGTWARLGMYDSGSFTSAGVFQPNETVWAHFEYACKTAKSAGLRVLWDAADTLRISNSLSNADWIRWQSSMWEYMAKRLGAYVDAWQVFNEHDGRDIRTFAATDNTTGANAAFFRAALEGARNAIRKHSAAPVGTTTFGYPMNEDRYQRWVRFHDAVSPQMDYVGIHAYPEFSPAILATFIQRLSDRYRKPVAVLEFGVPDAGGYGTPPDYLRVGDGIVAQNDALLSVKDRLLCATLYSLRNRVQGGTGEGGFGILDANWSKKAYWPRVVASIRRWS